MDKMQQAGIRFPQILIPEKKVNKQKWAVISCDQFTSNEDYWIKMSRLVGGAPSALHVIIPEVFVEAQDVDQRVSHAKEIMRSYIEDGVLVSLPEGMVLVERETPHGTRVGLVLAIDLEMYDADPDKKPLIRATEETVNKRMTVRIALREDAVLECPHVMLMINDPADSVLGPVCSQRESFAKIYETPLMQDGGHVEGWFVEDPDVLNSVVDALYALKKKAKDGMLFAVGDGNHSLGAAKHVWDNAKSDMTDEERETSPLRYALVEIVNLFDQGIFIHPIHRVLFNVDPPNALRAIIGILNRTGQEARMMYTRGTRGHVNPGSQAIRFESKMSKGYIEVTKPRHALVLQTLTEALDMLCEEMPRIKVDYIHGDDEFRELAHGHASLGFIMEPIRKEELFDAAIEYGVLPRKSFSLGTAEEKRHYFECRLLVEAEEESEDELPQSEEILEEAFEEAVEGQTELAVEKAVEETMEQAVEETMEQVVSGSENDIDRIEGTDVVFLDEAEYNEAEYNPQTDENIEIEQKGRKKKARRKRDKS